MSNWTTRQYRTSSWKPGQHARLVLAVAALLVSTLVVAQTGQEKNYKVIHDFGGNWPNGDLIRDTDNNLYGVSMGGAQLWGTVFKLDLQGHLTVLYNFAEDESQGSQPQGVLALDPAGNLYGTTPYGGAYAEGVVFKVDASGAGTVLHSFNGSDGSWPFSGIIRDENGNLYGTTFDGGNNGCGVVFKIDTKGEFTILHHFAIAEASEAQGNLVLDETGNLYGTSMFGGNYLDGTVYKLDVSGNVTVLHEFYWSDGARPTGGLIRDRAGNLYGTTTIGGDLGVGAIFKIDSAGNETVLYSFTGGADGSGPKGRLIRDTAGNLYGTTSSGGAYGLGTVFRLDPSGVNTVLHSFRGRVDSGTPFTGLTPVAGKLAGTARSTVFVIKP